MKNRNKEKNKNNSIYADLRKDLIKHLALAVPVLLVTIAVNSMESKFSAQPQVILYILFPLGFLTFISWKIIKGKKEFVLKGRFLILFLCVFLTLSIIAASGVLGGKVTLTGFDRRLARNYFSLNWMGDWRYKFALKKNKYPGLTIITTKPPRNLEIGRRQIARLIGYAINYDARGIGFDFHFERKTDGDSSLCCAVEMAKKKGIPVLFGYRWGEFNQEIRRIETVKSLRKCISLEQEGHTVGYIEQDGVVRMIPLYFRNEPDREAFCLKIAKILKPGIQIPKNGLLQFVKPKKDFNVYRYDELTDEDKFDPILFRDQFILVGEESDQDTALTPFGKKPGVMIHAYGVHSLLENHFIKSMPFWSHFLMIFVTCYWITVRVKAGDPFLKLLFLNVSISLIFLWISVFAILFFLTWIDIIYSLAAIWLLLPCLLLMREFTKQGKAGGQSKNLPEKGL
jgi:CHASE2 domain-containing sensor protein